MQTYSSAQDFINAERHIVAHRGGSRDYAEHSARAYRWAYAQGYRAFEVSVAAAQVDGGDEWTYGGGELFLMHDWTLDRTSGTDNMVAQLTPWSVISQQVIYPSETWARADAEPEPYLTLDEYLTEFGEQAIHFIDFKSLGESDQDRVIQKIKDHGLMHRCIGKQVGGTWNDYEPYYSHAMKWKNEGQPTWGALYDEAVPTFEQLCDFHDLVGLEWFSSYWSQLVAASPGKPRIAHIVNNTGQAAESYIQGATGIMSYSPGRLPTVPPGPPEEPEPELPTGYQPWASVFVGESRADAVYFGEDLIWPTQTAEPEPEPEPEPDPEPELIEITANAPTFDDEANTYTIPVTVGARYRVDGSVVVGTINVGDVDATITVVAEAREGYVLTGTTSWTGEFTKLPEVDPWELIYETDFATNDGWVARQETQQNDNSYNHPDNVSYGPRGMVIEGRRENRGGRPFTTADVTGQHITVPNYFRAEVTATLPTDYGMWPCPLWLRPLNSNDGEIDLSETWTYDWNGTPRSYSSIHPAYDHPTYSHETAQIPYSMLPNPDPAGVHTYTCIKTENRIEFLIDDVRVYCWEDDTPWSGTERIGPMPDWYEEFMEVPGRTWYPRVTLQLGGPNTDDPPPEWQSSEVIVHSLRIYREAN